MITRVRVTDREPYMGMDGRVRQWRWHDSATPSGLPSNLFDLLERHPSDIRKFVTMKTYPTRELSESALSEALIRLALE